MGEKGKKARRTRCGDPESLVFWRDADLDVYGGTFELLNGRTRDTTGVYMNGRADSVRLRFPTVTFAEAHDASRVLPGL